MMAQGDGSSRSGDAGSAASAAALRAQYRAARARLLGVRKLARSPVRHPPRRWLDDLIAFNEELRRLFLRRATRASVLSGERIREIVAAHYRITAAEMEGTWTTRRIAWPRQVAMYICARHAALPAAQIGRLLGNRDPSTVRFAIAAVQERIDHDPALAADIDRLVATWRDEGCA